jgi:acetyl-CoA carboxylase biotin carboxyl carrier protein
MKLSESDIAEIAQFLRDVDFDDLELEWGDLYLRIARRSWLAENAPARVAPAANVAIATAPMAHRDAAQPRDNQTRNESAPARQPGAAEPSASAPPGIVEVRSTLMGTLYRSPQPGTLPFVEVGTSVQPGDTLCLLEVMKVFTALKAAVAGTVERILVSDGDLVQYNQVIVWIRPA